MTGKGWEVGWRKFLGVQRESQVSQVRWKTSGRIADYISLIAVSIKRTS